jgi:ubiquinone/menaquinone biosynthesis C-methylase UbiE
MLGGVEAMTTGVEFVTDRLLTGLRAAADRAVAVAYGVVYDSIFECFAPYQRLQSEVRDLLERTAVEQIDRRQLRVLEIGCGPGNLSFSLAEAGFSVVGIDPYDVLIELGREKRRAERQEHLGFRHADLPTPDIFPDAAFDHVVSIHSLYAHPNPSDLLGHACRVLKPGGYSVFVNPTRPPSVATSFEAIRNRDGFLAALKCLGWLLPNRVFEATRRRVGPHYWDEEEFSRRLEQAGFTVLEMRRTFFNRGSLLAWVRKPTGG